MSDKTEFRRRYRISKAALLLLSLRSADIRTYEKMFKDTEFIHSDELSASTKKCRLASERLDDDVTYTHYPRFHILHHKHQITQPRAREPHK